MTAPYLSGSPYSYGDDMLPYDSFYIDPSLSNHWVVPVNEFLKDKQRTAIFNAEVNIPQTCDYYQPPAPGIPAVAQPAARFASPISSIEPSSASGTARSPPADTESYSDHASPQELFSPYPRPVQPVQHDQWNAPAHALQFEVMGPPFCVNPIEVNPSQQPDLSESETDGFHFDLSARTLSWDRFSQFDAEPAPYPATVATDSETKPVASPAAVNEIVKDEVNVASLYPPPPTTDLAMESDEDAAGRLSPKRKAEDDSDWKPPKKVRGSQPRSPPRPRHRMRPAPRQESPAQRGRPNPDIHLPRQTQQPARPLLPPSRAATKVPLTCSEASCQKQVFADQSALEQHIKKKHTRPYICVFHFAGCDSTFASKNEWKRHVASQHLLLHYWLCQEEECAKTCNGTQLMPTNAAKPLPLSSHQHQRSRTIASTSKDKQKKIPNGNIFNRKDLYTQHMRRMHMPEGVKKKLPASNKKTLSTSGSNAAVVQQWEEDLRRFQEKAIRARCALPEYMTCPAEGCSTEFRGAEAWDQRMEHVARHLDRAAQGGEPPVEFGGESDECLTNWAASGEVGIIELVGRRWVLKNGAGQGSNVRGSAADKPVRRERAPKAEADVEDEIVVGDEEDDERDAEGDMDDEV